MLDDHVMPTTRIVSWAIIPVLTAAFFILYLFPGRTKQLWAWTISPTMTPMLMGGGYLAGAYFFVRVVTTPRWHRVGLGFVAITAFTTFLLIGTLIHWDRFNHGHVSFWAWLGLYITTPFLLPWLWLRNRPFDPGTPEPADVEVPRPIRTMVASVGAVQLAISVAMLVRPSLFIDHWTWTLTPLTARTLAGFSAFPAVAYLAFAFESRWSALRVPIETALLGMVFILIAAIRAADEFHGSFVWPWRIGLVAAMAFLGGLWLSMQRASRARAHQAGGG